MRRASTALFLALIAAMCIAGFRAPAYNWDLLGYMGAAVEWDTYDSAAVHGRVYESARRHVPGAAFNKLTEGSADAQERSYRRDLYSNADHFVQQLPYYQVRPGYIALIYALEHAGVELVSAVHLLSVAGYAGLALLVFAWLARRLDMALAALAAALLALSPPMITVLRLASPDALSALMIAGGLFLFVETGCTRAAIAMIVASIAVRSDNVLLALMFLGMLAVSPRRHDPSLPELAIVSGIACAGYLLISAFAGHYGWATLFYHSFISFVPDPATHAQSLALAQYIEALARGMRTPFESSAMVFWLIGVVAYALPARTEAHTTLDRVLLLLAGNIVVRYVLFPAIWDRFLVAHYIVATVILVIKAMSRVPEQAWRSALTREAK